MVSSSSRLFALITLLSTRPSWTAAELADRMHVTERTIRRDVARLRDAGYGVDSDPGPWGGYRLGPGSAPPPSAFDDEEMLAVAVSLREAAHTGLLGDDQAVLSALFKLRRMLPVAAASRFDAMSAAFERTSEDQGPAIAPGVLAALATACRRTERLRLSYCDAQNKSSVREADPHRLVYTGHRWYLVARDVEKGEWRSFRADRVVDVQPTGHLVRLVDAPDAAKLIADMVLSHYPIYATVRLPVRLDDARRIVHATAGACASDGPDQTTLVMGGRNPNHLACSLLRLGVPFTVLHPASVREAVIAAAHELTEANAGTQ